MKKITFLLCLLTFSLGFSQANLEDFEGSPNLSGFEGLGGANVVANPSVDANNGSATVGELIVVQAGQPWQGANLIMQSNYMDVSDPVTNTVDMDVYSTNAFTMLARLAGGQNGATDSAADAAHSGSGWETLTFTFNENLDGTGSANGEYDTIALFPNWTGSGWNDPEIEITVYVDNLTAFVGGAIDTCSNGVQDGDETGVDCGGSCPNACPSAPTVAAPTPPNRAPADVISIYSDAYAGSVGLNNVPWDDPSNITEEMIAGDPTLKVDFDQFLGSDLGSVVDATAMTHFHLDYYIADSFVAGQVFNLKWSNHTGGAGETNAGELNIALPGDGTLNQTWVSVDVPLTDFSAGINPREALTQFLITVAGLIDVAYIDNIYFHNNMVLSNDEFETLGFKVFPNPTKGEWNISGNSVIDNISVYDILGKQVISLTPNSTETKIDASTLKTGVYFARIEGANGSKTMKLVRQ